MTDQQVAVSGLPSPGTHLGGWTVSLYKRVSWNREDPLLVKGGLSCRFGARLCTVVRGAVDFGLHLRKYFLALHRLAERGMKMRLKEAEATATPKSMARERNGWVNLYHHDMITEWAYVGANQKVRLFLLYFYIFTVTFPSEAPAGEQFDSRPLT